MRNKRDYLMLKLTKKYLVKDEQIYSHNLCTLESTNLISLHSTVDYIQK
jgi:hypothetical protein